MTWEKFFTFITEQLNVVLFTLKQTKVTPLSILIFILFMALFILLGNIIRRILFNRVFNRFELDQGTKYTFSRVAQYLVVTIGVLISFQFIGIDLSSLAVVFGLLSVGIGFGLQNLTSNFISGLIILFERPISVGDRVIVNDIEGDVTEINIRSTKIRTLNNVSIIVPNSNFVSQEVVNYSFGDPTYRVDIEVGVSYGSDLENVLKVLKEVAEENENVMKNPEPEVHLKEFGESSWNMEVRAWIDQVYMHPRIRNELNRAIVRKFRENGIVIPFPQRDLHVRSSVPVPHKTVGNSSTALESGSESAEEKTMPEKKQREGDDKEKE